MELPSSQPMFEGSSEPEPLIENGEFSYRLDSVTAESLQSLVDETVAKCDILFDEILDSQQRTYDSIVVPHIEMCDILQHTFSFLSALSMVHANSDIRSLASKALMDLTWDSNEYIYSFAGSKTLCAYGNTEEAGKLKGEQKLYLQSALEWVEDSGFDLPRGKRQKLKKFHTYLQTLEEEFLQNISEDTTALALSGEEVAGLDDQSKAAYLTDLGNGHYELGLVESTYTGFMSSAASREARQKAYETYTSRYQEPGTQLLQEAVYARQKIARLLGCESWVELGSKYNMVKSPEQIFNLYKSLVPGLKAKAKQEISVMEEMLLADGHHGPLQVYDLEYYEARLLKEKYAVDLDSVREYLPLPAVLAAAFDLAGKLFDINFREQEASGWHPDVLSFAIDDAKTAKQIGTLYMDLFPREGKYKGCCCMSLVVGRAMPEGEYRQPSSLIIANLPAPADGEPALLSQGQRVDVAFHEFGHALHDILTKVNLPAFAGVAAAIDFVEVPSQIMENWAWDAGILKKYARHYKTGEPMPDNMIEALIDSKNVNQGIKYLHYISKGLFDLYLHNSLEPVDIEECWKQATEVSAFADGVGSFGPATFDHVMSSYAGAYYSYVYDEIFCSDMFRRFQQEGLLNPETGKDYRQKILEPGATKHGRKLIKEFLGRQVDTEVFLRNLDITATAEI